jgi:hypothetical protein
MTDTYDVIELPAGTLVHVEGLPFSLAKATEVHGREANLGLTAVKGTVTARGRVWPEPEPTNPQGAQVIG